MHFDYELPFFPHKIWNTALKSNASIHLTIVFKLPWNQKILPENISYLHFW